MDFFRRLSNNVLLLFDLHVMQYESEVLDSVFGVFTEFTSGEPKPRIIAITNKAIYLLSLVMSSVSNVNYCEMRTSAKYS